MLVATLALQGPDLDQKIALEEPAQSAPAFLAKLSKLTRCEIAAPGPLSRNTLVVRFDDTPLRVILDRLGDSLSAKWRVVEGKKVEFYRPASLLRSLREHEDAARKEAISKGLKAVEVPELTEALAAKIAARARAFEPRLRQVGRDPAARQERQALQDSMPVGRAAAKITQAVPLDRYLGMKVGERIVFSSSPNSMQISLPGGMSIVREFNTERAIMRRALADDLKREDEMLTFTDPRAGQFKLKSEAVKVVAGISRTPEVRGFLVNVRFVDADGWVVSSASTAVPDTVTGKPVDLEPVQVEVSDPNFRLTEAIRSFGQPSQEERRKAVAVLTDPNRYDPQGWYHGDLILDYSRRTKKPIVASLSDRGMRRLWLAMDTPAKSMPSKTLATLMANEWGLSLVEQKGTTIVSPVLHLTAESDYLDRAEMSLAFGKMVKEGRLAILDAAEYANSSKSALAGQFAEWSIAGWGSPHGFGSPDQELVSSWFATMRFVGHLPGASVSPGARPLAVSELSPEARVALKRWIMDVPFTLMFGELRDAEHPYDHITRTEPTEALPNGVPGSTQIRLTWSESPLILIGNDVGLPPTMQPYKWLAYMMAPEYANDSRYDTVTGKSLKIDLIFPDGRTASEEVWEAPPASTEARNYRRLTELPAAVLSLMRAEYARTQAQHSIGGRLATPPPAFSD